MHREKYFTHVEPFFDEIKSWREQGLSEEEISKKLHIAYSTLRKYREKYSAFSAVLQHSKLKLVNNLKKSLYKESMGFEYEEVETVIEESYLGTKKKIRKVKKHARSQPQLLIFALCNLCPEQFQRIDKDAYKEIEEQIEESRKSIVDYTDKKIENAYFELYPHLKEKKYLEKKENDNEYNGTKK